MSTPPFKPVPKTDTDRIFCCPLLPETALDTLLSRDNPPPSPTNPIAPTQQQIYDAHVPIKTNIKFPDDPLVWMLRNFVVWAESHDKGELEEGGSYVRKREAGIECYGGLEERVIRACHGLRVERFKKGQEGGFAECVKYFLPLFDAGPEIKEGDSRRICRFSEVPWEVVEVVDVKGVREFGEALSCFCGGRGKVYKCAYVGEILIDTSVLEEEGRREEMKYQVGWGSVKSKVIQRVKDTLDFGWGWS